MLSVLALAPLGSAPVAGEVGPAPAEGDPFPGDGGPINYEDVLDRSDLVLAGKVTKVADGRLDLEVAKVLRGELTGKSASLSFAGSWADTPYQPPVEGQAGAFFCLRGKDGRLRLAGNPPRGGGFAAEGPELVEKLIEAARDPRQGYQSKDPAVRLSSACRLVKVWAAAEAGKRPELPADLVEVLLDGLDPGPLRGRQVNSAARYALNTLLSCDLNRLAKYSTNQDDATRKARAALAREIWQRTVAKVQERRGAGPARPAPDENEAKAARLVAPLGDGDYQRRETAQQALAEMGKPALKAVEEGARSKDAEIADRCRRLLETLRAGGTAPPAEVTFDLDRAEPFIPRPAKAPAKKPRE